jgi:adenosylmethionine-8-amino-7-oxononanoate aminotransferase
MLGLTHEPGIRLAHRLVNLVPWGLDRVFYSDDGSTAVEAALKMAFQYHQQTGHPERTRFAALRDGYHGDTVGAVSIGSIPLFHEVYRPLLFDAVALPAPRTPGDDEQDACLAQALVLLEEHGASLAALVFEPLVQGAAGMKMHTSRYLKPLLQRARELDVLLVADEVAVGFGRTGTMFAMEQVGVAPDLLCLAKGLSGGYLPLAATLATERVFRAFLGAPGEHRQFFHGHTYTGNPLACAAALASLDLFETEGVIARVGRMEGQLRVLLRGLRRRAGVAAIRHKGVMVGIDLCAADGAPLDPALRTGHRVAMACRPRGALVRPLGDTLVLNPPLSMEGQDLTDLVRIAGEAIRDVSGP